MEKICFKKKVAQKVVKAAKKSSELVANISCIWWDYQAKLPKSVKKCVSSDCGKNCWLYCEEIECH